MKKILLGLEAKHKWELLEKSDWKSRDVDRDLKGGIFQSEIPGIWVAYDCTDGSETFVEDFDNLVEAAKYASGIIAKTIDRLEI